MARPTAVITLWSASGVCAFIALGVYFYADSLGSILIGIFATGWLTALLTFLRAPSND
jgi:hypothetical protein